MSSTTSPYIPTATLSSLPPTITAISQTPTTTMTTTPTVASSSWGPVFFTNYVHCIGLEETKEFAGRRLIHNCQVWQAAAVSAATPPLFRPQTVGMFYQSFLFSSL
jgi:hypothetical protein